MWGSFPYLAYTLLKRVITSPERRRKRRARSPSGFPVPTKGRENSPLAVNLNEKKKKK